MGKKCRQYLRKCLFTPFMGCAQIDHAPRGLVRRWMSSGHPFSADRSGSGEPPGVAERPGDVRLATTEAKRRPSPGALGGPSHPRGEMTFPLCPLCGLPLCVLPIQPYPGEGRSGLRLSGKAACAAGSLRERILVWHRHPS